jgi:hypothetical protein
MATFNQVLSQVKQGIREVSVEDTKARVLDNRSNAPVLVDVRERDEYEQGFIPSAEWIPRGFLELKIEDLVPDRDREVVVYCAPGRRHDPMRRSPDSSSSTLPRDRRDPLRAAMGSPCLELAVSVASRELALARLAPRLAVA